MRSAERMFCRFEVAFDRATKTGRNIKAQYDNRRWWFSIGTLHIVRQVNEPRDWPSIHYKFEMDGLDFHLHRFEDSKGNPVFSWLLREPDDLQRAELKLIL